MFDAHRKSTGIGRITTVASLTVAFIFTLAALAMSHPFGSALLAPVLACMTLSLTARFRSPQTIGTVE
jgi:hypothetical protein